MSIHSQASTLSKPHPPPPRRRSCNLKHHDLFLSSKYKSYLLLQAEYPTCPHCRTDWTYLLKPPSLSELETISNPPSSSSSFSKIKIKTGKENENKVLKLDDLISQIVIIKFQDPDFRAAISHFCEVELSEGLKEKRIHRWEREVSMRGGTDKREIFLVRVRQQRILDLLRSFYKDLYFEAYTALCSMVSNPPLPSSPDLATIPSPLYSTFSPKVSNTPIDISRKKWKYISPTEYCMMISVASWYSHFKMSGTWEDVCKAYPGRVGRGEKMFRGEFIRGSKVAESLRAGLRGLRKCVVVLGGESIEEL